MNFKRILITAIFLTITMHGQTTSDLNVTNPGSGFGVPADTNENDGEMISEASAQEEIVADSTDSRERPMEPMEVGLEIGKAGEDAHIASDKVGIGTSTPSSKLDIDGTIRIRTIDNAAGDILTVSGTGVVQQRTPEEIRTDIGAARDINSVYYVEGNTSGTSGTWTGNIDGLTEYYDGLKVAYKIGISGASTTTLNINGLGAVTCRRNTGNLTTHLPVGTVVDFTYTTISGTGYWVWADYSSSESYTVRWNNYLQAGAEITRYKIVMSGTDGKYYPLTIGNTTAATKTVASTEFRINSPIVAYYTNGTIAADGISRYYFYEGMNMGYLDYTLNQSSGMSAYMPVYLVGTVNASGNFVLDGAGGVNNDFWTQTLPSSEDGKVYIMIGIMYNTTTTMRLMVNKPIYEYKDGKIRPYDSGTDDQIASEVSCTDEFTYSSATNVQDVLDDLDAAISSAGDNLGNHTATMNLDINDYGIIDINWGASDDGSGSGLDADLLDGHHWSEISSVPTGTNGQTLRNNAGTWVANNVLYNNGTNVGIGTASPGTPLAVNSSAYGYPVTSGTEQTYGGLRLQSSGGNVVLDAGINTSNGVWMQVTNITNLGINYPLLLNPNGGRIGIGTVSPANAFHVVGADDKAIFEDGVAGQAYIELDFSSAGSPKIGMSDKGNDNAWAIGADDSDNSLKIAGGTLSSIPALASNTKMTILPTGEVGLGTSSPGTPLDLAFSSSSTSNLMLASAMRIANTNATNNNEASIIFSGGGTSRGPAVQAKFTDHTVRSADLCLWTLNAGSLNKGLTIKDAGNVGIGVDSPSNRLEVAGQASYFATANMGSDDADFAHKKYVDDLVGTITGDNLGNHIATENVKLSGFWLSNDGGSEGVYVDTYGDVGIGTSTPDHKLQVIGHVMIGETDATGGKLYLYGTTTGKYSEIYTTNGNLHIDAGFGTGGSDNIYLNYYAASGADIMLGTGANKQNVYFNTDGIWNASGNVGIGTTTPASKLDISAEGDGAQVLRLATERPWVFRQSGADASSQLELHSEFAGKTFKITSDDGSSSAEFFVTGSADADRVYLVPDVGAGMVGIGTRTPGAKLEIAGQVKITGGTPGVGKVLTSDVDGLATWEIPSVSSSSDYPDNNEPYVTSALGAIQPRVAMYNGTVEYGTIENNTIIYRNGVEVVNATTPTTGTFSVTQGDILTTNKPAGMIDNTYGLSIPPVSSAGTEHVFYSVRYSEHTVYIYSPYSVAKVDYYLDGYETGTPTQTITINPGTVSTLTLPTTEGLTCVHRFYSSAPVIIAKLSAGDHIFVPPASKEIIHTLSGARYTMESATVSSYNNIRHTSDSRLGSMKIADGAGGDADLGLPYRMLGDTYIITHPIGDFAIASVEPNVISVYYYSGGSFTLYDEYDHTAASRSNPVKTEVGVQSGVGPIIISSAPILITGQKPFYLRTNDPSNQDEYAVIGYRQSLRDYISGGGAGDNWGSQTVETDASLSGDGTSGNVLKVANGATKATSTNFSLFSR